MKTSAQGRAFIEAFEGLFLKTYNDGEGVLTIGYGHTSAAGYPAVARGMVITSDQADQFLVNDLAKVEVTVARAIKVPITQPEFDALVSFEFNTGSLIKSSVDDKINKGQKSAAMDTLMEYVHGANTKQIYSGLVRRRKGERKMFEGDVAGALKVAEVHQEFPPMPMPQKVGPPPVSAPSAQPVSKPSGWAAFLLAIVSLFKRKS